MQLRILFLAVPLLAAATERDPRDDISMDAHSDLEALPLEKRACTANGCKCRSGFAGVYCAQCVSGGSYIVTDIGHPSSLSDVYQCDGSGGCCDYGKASACASGATGRCG